jgi:hypothetical protein
MGLKSNAEKIFTKIAFNSLAYIKLLKIESKNAFGVVGLLCN